ncbi:MAG TPA: hypothetical protein VHT68_07820 [Pseudolabrys sp.]|jgi:hypothetical protein|nr:hypothetical protein [Pseudolabrys sp.]
MKHIDVTSKQTQVLSKRQTAIIPASGNTDTERQAAISQQPDHPEL